MQQTIFKLELRNALRVSNNVAKVSDVPFAASGLTDLVYSPHSILGRAVSLAVGVEVATRRNTSYEVSRYTCENTVCNVAELMDVESMLLAWCKAGDLALNNQRTLSGACRELQNIKCIKFILQAA